MKKHNKKRPRGFVLALGVPGLIGIIIPILIAVFVPSMIGYTKKSHAASAQSTATIMYRASNAAVEEMYCNDANTLDNCIISSDRDKNYNVGSNVDIDTFYEYLGYYSDSENVEYFLVFSDGYCTDAAVIGDNGYVGTYGSDLAYSTAKNFKELYEEACDLVD